MTESSSSDLDSGTSPLVNGRRLSGSDQRHKQKIAQKKKHQKKRAKEEKKRKSVSENSTAPSSKRAGTGEIEEVSLEQIPLPSPPPAIEEGTDPSKSYIAEIVECRSAAQALQGAVPKLPTYIHEVPKEKLLPVGRSNKHLFDKRVLYEADPGLATTNVIFFCSC